MSCYTFDVEVHDPEKCEYGKGFIQARYLVHGWEDVLWTDDIKAALDFIKESLENVPPHTPAR